MKSAFDGSCAEHATEQGAGKRGDSPNYVHSAPLPASASPTAACFSEALRQHFPSRESLIQEASAMTTAQQRRKRMLAGVGAALPLILISVALWLDPAWRTSVLQTDIGKIGQYTLPDGSRVVLNTDSRLMVQERLRTRSLVLEKGEAAFTVAPDWRPFIVHSGPIRVRDLSTAFSVQDLAHGRRITVLEGAVEVDDTRTQEAALVPSLVLKEGQRIQTYDNVVGLRAPDGRPLAIETINLAEAKAWQQGRIVFNGTPLTQAIADIQRYREQPIVLAAPALGSLRLSGVYDVQHIEQLLDSLPRALPVRIERKPDGQLLIHPKS